MHIDGAMPVSMKGVGLAFICEPDLSQFYIWPRAGFYLREIGVTGLPGVCGQFFGLWTFFKAPPNLDHLGALFRLTSEPQTRAGPPLLPSSVTFLYIAGMLQGQVATGLLQIHHS